MSVTRKELEKLLTKNDEMSQYTLDYFMQTMPRDLLADHLFSIMRRQQYSITGIVLMLVFLFGWCLRTAASDDTFVPAVVVVVGIMRGFTFIRDFRAGARISHRHLTKLHDIRALPGVLGKSPGNEYWQGQAVSILNRATIEGWPSSMSASAKSTLLRRVVKLLEKFSKQGNATISDTEADMLIAAARFLVVRQPIASQAVLHKVATSPAPEVANANLWLVRETVQSLVGNTAPPDRAEISLEASVR